MNQSLAIIQNGTVFTGDSHQRSGPWAILVQGGRIAKIGTSGDALRTMYPTAEVIDASGKIILPGFVEPHIHGESFLLRFATSLLSMTRWAKEQTTAKAFKTLYSEFNPEELRTCYELAYFAALRNGVTALSEFGFDRLAMPVVAAGEAFRRTDLFGVIGIHNGEQAEIAKSEKRSTLRYSVVLPDADSLTTYSLQTRLRLAREEQWGVTMALAENRRDAESIRKNFQRSVVQLAQEHGLLGPLMQIAHLAYVDPGDIDLLAKAKIPVLLNPNGILAKGTELPSLPDLIRGQIPLALCTDWGIADPLSNIRSYVAMVRSLGLTVPKPETLLSMVTSLPSRALGLLDDIGTLEPGKRANLIFVDINDFRFGSGSYRRSSDALLHVLLNASSDRVTEVMINGEFYVRNGEFLTIAGEDLAGNMRRLLERLLGPMRSEGDLAIVERPTESASSISTDDLPFEEGFRVVRKAESAERIFQLPDRLPSGPELPKDVHRVFGEDDPD